VELSRKPAVGAARSADPYLPAHGNGGYHVEHYDLEIEYKVAANRLTGRAALTAVAAAPLSRFSLDLGGFRVPRVRVDGRAAKFTRRDGKLHVTPARPVAGRFSVEVRYVGSPRPVASPWGDLGWDELTDGALVASQPIGAPSWFPCNDHPADKAAYRIAVTAPAGYTVQASGEPVGRTRHGRGVRWSFERPEPTATYQVSVQVGRYTQVPHRGDGVPQRAAVPARLRAMFLADFGRQDSIMATMRRFFGPYPFAGYTVVVTDDDLEEPVEAQGLAVFGANHLDGLRTHERLVAHALAHQWFGASLTVADWRHVWLNEGFATYAEWLWSEASGGVDVGLQASLWYDRLTERATDIRIGDPGVDLMLDERIAKRGALMLQALRRRLGDVDFFAMLREWTTENRHGLVSTEGFAAAAQRHADASLAGLFTDWLWEKALPRPVF
jgi:aminopeptidase N